MYNVVICRYVIHRDDVYKIELESDVNIIYK